MPADVHLVLGNVSCSYQTIVMPRSSCCCRFSDSYIVRVKAVVMTRDDSSGGWFPQEGGGISRVGVCKVMHPEGNGRSGFLIHGERQKDKLVIADTQHMVKSATTDFFIVSSQALFT